MKAIKFIFKILKKYPLSLSISIFLLTLTSLIDGASILFLIGVVDLFLNSSLITASGITRHILAMLRSIGLPGTLGWVMAIFLIFIVLKTAFQIFSQFYIFRIKYAIMRDLIVGTFNDFLNARWYFFSSNKQGMLLNTLSRELNVVGDAIGVLGLCLSSLFQLVLFILVPFFLSWQLTSIIIGIASILAVPFLMLGRINYCFGKVNTSTANELNKITLESIVYAKVIIGFSNQRKFVNTLRSAFDLHRQATLKSQTFNQAMPLAYYPVGLTVLFCGFFISRKISLPLAETMVLFYSLSRIIPVIGTVLGHKSALDNFLPSYEQITELRNRAIELRQQTGSKRFERFNEKITLEDLSFGYPDHPLVLENISMSIPKGKMTAIVGDSGGGKSTLIDMVMRFNEPLEGKVSFDNTDVREFEISSYRRVIGYVPQDAVLFNMSIRDNLLWANDQASQDDIVNACRQANAEEFISRLPDGYDTLVGDRGVRLSGGQVQRIALARAILRKPQLLILDEATSALDTNSERMIQYAIENIAKETTVVIVAHRLSTIINASYIYVLKDGRIAEEGTYAELIRQAGKFKKMIELQSLAVQD